MLKLQTPYFIFFFLLLHEVLPAQSNNLADSLRDSLKNCQTDTGKLNFVSKITLVQYKQSHFDSILFYAGKGLELSRKTVKKKLEAGFYQWLGVAWHLKGNYDKALENNLAALKLYEEINYKKGIAAMLNNIGSIAGQNGICPEYVTDIS